MTIGEPGISDFTVELDRPDRQYRGGETLRGKVEIPAVDDSVRGVKLSLEWHTAGEGNEDSLVVATRSVPVVTHDSVGTAVFAFSLPNGPVTYFGPTISVAWRLVVSIDVAWARDPSRILLLKLAAGAPQLSGGDGGIYRSAPVVNKLQPDLGPQAKPAGTRTSKGLGATIFGGLAFGAFAMQFHGMGLLMAPIAFLIAGGATWATIRNARDRSALGAPTVELLPSEAQGGEQLLVRVSFVPKHTLGYLRSTATLHGEEITVKGSGSSSTTKRRDLHHDVVTLPGPSSPVAGTLVEMTARITIPPNAAPTFASRSNDVSWTVKLVIEARKDRSSAKYAYDEELVLHVHPR